MGVKQRLYLRRYTIMSSFSSSGSTRCGPLWFFFLKGVIFSCSGVTLGDAAGFGDLAVVVRGTLGSAAGEACGLTRAASRMVDSCHISTSLVSTSWENA